MQTKLESWSLLISFTEYDEFVCSDICQLKHSFMSCGDCVWRTYDRFNLNLINMMYYNKATQNYRVRRDPFLLNNSLTTVLFAHSVLQTGQ